MAGRCDDVVPAIREHGVLESSPDQHWLIMEDLPHRGRSDIPDTARAIMHAAARFQQEAAALELATYPIDVGFVRTHGLAALDHDCPGPVGELLRRVESDDAWLRANRPYVKCHGDVHPWNAVAAQPPGRGG